PATIAAIFTGDGGPAIAAEIAPAGMALDGAGNLFIADAGRVRKIGPTGLITTVAGNGSGKFSGDGGPALAAGLVNPTAVAVDASGNLFIADPPANRVREVSPNGTIATVAGNGTYGFSG